MRLDERLHELGDGLLSVLWFAVTCALAVVCVLGVLAKEHPRTTLAVCLGAVALALLT